MESHRQTKGMIGVEWALVGVIVGIIAASTVPRLSQGKADASGEAQKTNLVVLSRAIEMYAQEHDGTWPEVDLIVKQLTHCSDAAGNTNPVRTRQYTYGPYLHKVPPMPQGLRKGATGIAAKDNDGVGWLYNETTGKIIANNGSGVSLAKKTLD